MLELSSVNFLNWSFILFLLKHASSPTWFWEWICQLPNAPIELSQNNTKAKELLGKLLVSEKLITDLNKGQMILNELKSKNNLSPHLKPLLQKVEKQIKIDQNYNFCKFTGYLKITSLAFNINIIDHK